MSKLDDILYKPMTEGELLSYKLGDDAPIHSGVKEEIKTLMLELIDSHFNAGGEGDVFALIEEVRAL